ncbi:MAG TPA: hypothetical protein VKX34_10050 [Aequorivita sp.]|nr:hypothetical protein [Aequorivita sp.]
MKAFYILIFTTVLLFSCNSVKRTQKYVAKGDYDKAISLAVKKLQKDKNAKEYDGHIYILEEAFRKANEEDQDRISLLKRQNSEVGKREIYYTYLQMQDRQNLVRPLLPLYSKEMGRNGRFEIVNYKSELLQAQDAFVSSLYSQAYELMQRNNKQDYRNAFNVLTELEGIQPNYRDTHNLKEEAHFLGTDFVFVKLNNHTGQLIPHRLQRELLDFNTYGLDDLWTEYHSQKESGIRYDLGIDLNFQAIDISPERISEKQFTRKERVKDGFNYRRDRAGNIVKDSLGNPIKIDKMINVTAVLTVTTQQKNVFVGGTVIYKDLHRNQQINNFPLSTEFVFENVFATYRGDKRALSTEDIKLTENNFHPFPNNEHMVFDAGTDIKERLKEILKKNSFR